MVLRMWTRGTIPSAADAPIRRAGQHKRGIMPPAAPSRGAHRWANRTSPRQTPQSPSPSLRGPGPWQSMTSRNHGSPRRCAPRDDACVQAHRSVRDRPAPHLLPSDTRTGGTTLCHATLRHAASRYNHPDGPPRMVKRPTGSGGEPSSPNCGASAGVRLVNLISSSDLDSAAHPALQRGPWPNMRSANSRP